MLRDLPRHSLRGLCVSETARANRATFLSITARLLLALSFFSVCSESLGIRDSVIAAEFDVQTRSSTFSSLLLSSATTTTPIWSATLTVGGSESRRHWKGFIRSENVGELTDETITHEGSTARWEEIAVHRNGRLSLIVVRTSGGQLDGSYKVCLHGQGFEFNPFSGRRLNEISGTNFPYTDISWVDDETVEASLVDATAACPNVAPRFGASSYEFTLGENDDGSGTAVSLGSVSASDGNSDDTLTYSIQGGNTSSKFAINSTTGAITYVGGGENFEGFATPVSAFSLTIRASDGTLHTDVTAMVSVTDVDEPPIKPAAPSVSPTASSTTSLDVTWNAPSNAGRPAIESYDLRYKVSTATEWTDGPEDVTTRSRSIGSLQAGTEYNVQVRATNDEGDSTWSDTGSGTTSSPPNALPIFGASSYTFTLEENADGSTTAISVGTVSATDADAGDTVTYSIQSGNTDSKFAIGSSTGAIEYGGSGENFEDFATPVSAFSLTVRASDGTANVDVTVKVSVRDVDEPPRKPSAPSVSPTASSTTSLDVSWTAPSNTGRPDIDSYDLRYKVTTATEWTDGPEDVTTSPKAIGSLQAGTEYDVQIRATNDEGDSAWSDSGSGTTSSPPNAAPVFGSTSYTFTLAENDDGSTTPVALGTVSATDADSGDTVTFSIQSGNTDSKFVIGSSTGTITYAGSGENFEDFATPLSAYSLAVRASDGTANVDVTVKVSVTDVDEPPVKPSAPSVSPTANSITSLDVSWTAPSNTGRPAIDSYDLRYKVTTATEWTNGPEDVTTSPESISSLQSGTAYQVQVRATNDEGDSAWSDSGSATTSSPSNTAPVFGAASYAFTLEENANGGTTPVVLGTVSATDADSDDTVTYSIQSGNAGSRFAIGSSTGGVTYIGGGENFEGFATPASAFSLTIRASDGTANVDITATISVTDIDEPPDKPSAPSASPTANSTTSLDVRWNAPPNLGRPAIESYDLRYKVTTAIGWTRGPQDVTTTFRSIGSLQSGTAYQVQVRATNDEGDSSWSDSGSGSTTTEVDDETPIVPVSVAPVFGAGSYSFNLAENTDGRTTPVSVGSVSASDADGADTITFSIQSGNAESKFTIGSSSGDISYVGGGENYEGFVTPANAFILTVRASDGTAHAEVSVTVQVTDVDEPPGKPTAPSVSATANSTTSLDVSWRVPTNIGRPAIQHYDSQYRTGTTGDWTDGPQDVTATTTSIGNLQAGTTYQVRVRATNDEGDGPWSDPGSSTTTAQGAIGSGDDPADAPGDTPPSDPTSSNWVTVLASNPLLVYENDSTLYQIKLGKRPSGIVTIKMSCDDASIASVASKTLTFTPDNWGILQNVLVRGVNDDRLNPVVEGFDNDGGRTTYIRHTVSGGGFDGMDAKDVLVFVADDDHVHQSPTDIEVTLSPSQVNEGAGTQRITVTTTLLGGTLRDDTVVSVTCTRADADTARLSTDLSCGDTQFTFSADLSSVSTNFEVTPLDDSEVEGDETFSIEVSLTDAAVTGRTFSDSATVTIVDDDISATIVALDTSVTEGASLSFKVTLSLPAPAGDSGEGLLVHYRVSDPQGSSFLHPSEMTNPNGKRTLVPPGATEHTFTVLTIDDQNDEPDGDVRVELNEGEGYVVESPLGAAVTVLDNDEARFAAIEAVASPVTAGEPAEFTVSLSYESSDEITISLSMSESGSGDVVSAVDEGTTGLVFPPGVTEKRFIVPTRDPRVAANASVRVTIATGEGYTPGGTSSATVTVESLPPAIVGVFDTRVSEGAGAMLSFTVTLNRASSRDASVDYATYDGTAKADEDYTATLGTLRFEAGESAGVVEIPVLNDAHDEGDETLWLVLTNPQGVIIGHPVPSAGGQATGIIEDSDPIPSAWLARFGRTVSSHVADAIGERVRDGPPHSGESQFTIAGRRFDGVYRRIDRTSARRSGRVPRPTSERSTGAEERRRSSPTRGSAADSVSVDNGIESDSLIHNRTRADPFSGYYRADEKIKSSRAVVQRTDGSGSRDSQGLVAWLRLGGVNWRDAVAGTSFDYSSSATQDIENGVLDSWSAWGRGARTRFDGADGSLAVTGDVVTATIGTDTQWRRWKVGIALSHSLGEGDYTAAEGGRGDLESSLTSLNPYAGLTLNDRLYFWGTVGLGTGKLTLSPEGAGAAIEMSLRHTMGALGGRGVFMRRANGFQLAMVSDAIFSDTVAGPAAGEGAASRVRVMLEGLRSIPVSNGSVLRPSLAAGLRYDGGDAETGTGVELGGGLAYLTGPLKMNVDARGLLTHRDESYEEWGFGGSVSWQPGGEHVGFSMNVGSSWGQLRGADSLWDAGNVAGFGHSDAMNVGQRMRAEIGYGLEAHRGIGLWRPFMTVESGDQFNAYRLGLTLSGFTGVEAVIEIGRRMVPIGPPEDAIRLHGALLW